MWTDSLETNCFLSALPDRELILWLHRARKSTFNHYFTLFASLIVHWRHRDPRTFFKLSVMWSASSSVLWLQAERLLRPAVNASP